MAGIALGAGSSLKSASRPDGCKGSLEWTSRRRAAIGPRRCPGIGAMSTKPLLAAKRKRGTIRQDRASAALRPSTQEMPRSRSSVKRVLVIDVGGTSVKILATGQTERRSFPSGRTLTPRRMVSRVKKLAADWTYDVVSIGYPGPVLGGWPVAEPRNLGRGWVGFDFERAFARPVKVVNDAAMQALGSYEDGKMLFLGLGTGLGTAMIVEGTVAPMELGHLPYKKGTYEDYVGRAGASSAMARKSGGATWPTSWSASLPLCSLTRSSLEAAM